MLPAGGTPCFDACGQVREKDEFGVGETSYVCDAEGQLTEVEYPAAGTDTLTYDNNGNRTQWTRTDAATIAYAYNAADQLTKSTEGTIGTSYSRDDNGNLTGQTTQGVTRSYSYDPFDRMTSVVEGDASLQSMTYAPDGKRLSLTDSGGTRKFFYDRDDVIQEYDSDWSSVNREYTHGPWVDEPLSITVHGPNSASSPTRRERGASAQGLGAEALRLMKDPLGSTINILDENEALETTDSVRQSVIRNPQSKIPRARLTARIASRAESSTARWASTRTSFWPKRSLGPKFGSGGSPPATPSCPSAPSTPTATTRPPTSPTRQAWSPPVLWVEGASGSPLACMRLAAGPQAGVVGNRGFLDPSHGAYREIPMTTMMAMALAMEMTRTGKVMATMMATVFPIIKTSSGWKRTMMATVMTTDLSLNVIRTRTTIGIDRHLLTPEVLGSIRTKTGG